MAVMAGSPGENCELRLDINPDRGGRHGALRRETQDFAKGIQLRKS